MKRPVWVDATAWVAVAAIVAYAAVRVLRERRQAQEGETRDAGTRDAVDEASEESFPASDAPAWAGSR